MGGSRFQQRIKRRDANEWHLLQLLRLLGTDVWRADAFDGGLPDLVVIHNDNVCFIEVKTLRGKLKDTQNEFLGKLANAYVARSVQDIMCILLSLDINSETEEMLYFPPIGSK